ncbi:hypothetical protein Pmani_037351, partial [Petrolisthes manimaculis]
MIRVGEREEEEEVRGKRKRGWQGDRGREDGRVIEEERERVWEEK